MNMVIKISTLILQYVIGIVFAFLFGLFLWCICFLPAMISHKSILYVDTTFYLMIFVAFPLGGAFGMSYVDKWIFKEERDKAKMIAAFLVGAFSIWLVFWIIPAICDVRLFSGSWVERIFGKGNDIFLFPFVAVFFSLISYNVVDLFRRD